jgi:trehalose 6-phosphate phosphatase
MAPDTDLIGALAAQPEHAAVLLDVDGTLAPIVERPEDARVPDETLDELVRLVQRYALVGCISGRPGDDVRRMLGVDGVTVVGEHGLELAPEAVAWAERIAAFANDVDWPAERKPLSVSFHFRRADDEDAARAYLTRIADAAAEAGFHPRWGRKVLEVRPPVTAHKGTAVRTLVERAGVTAALYAGDDTTDIDGFDGLDGLDLAVRVAVDSGEAPPALLTAADLVVDGTEGVLALLRRL